MKKALIITLAALLTCALAVPAMAAPKVAWSGSSEWVGYYVSNPGAMTPASDAEPRAWGTMITSINCNVIIAPNLFFKVGFEGLNKWWGAESHKDANASADGGEKSSTDWTHAQLTYISPIGIFLVGHWKSNNGNITGSGGGLAGYGLQGSHVGAYANWLGSFGSSYDQIIYVKSFGKSYRVTAYFLKYYEHDAVTASELDGDVDKYSINNAFTWETGGAQVAFEWSRVRYPVIMNAAGDWYSNAWLGIPYQIPVGDDVILNALNVGDSDWYYIVGKVGQSFGPITVGGQFEYRMGTIEGAGSLEGETYSSTALKYYLEVRFASGPIDAGALYHHTGMGALEDGGSHGTVGSAYRPLYAFYAKNNAFMTGFLSGGPAKYNELGNHNLLCAFFEYNVIEKMWIRVAYGILQWSTPEFYTLTDLSPAPSPYAGLMFAGTAHEVNKNIGSELDFGINYQLAKALNLGVHFGYFMPGQGWEDFMALMYGSADAGASYLAELVLTLRF